MFKLKLVIVAALLAAVFLTQLNSAADCDKCAVDITGLICINETAYEFCWKGDKSGVQGSCETGKICKDGLCQISSETVEADCKDVASCKKCNNNFACVSKTEFAICADGEPTDVVLTCPDNNICDINNDDLCVDCTGTPTCSNSEVKKPDPTVDYADSCGSLTEGKFDYYPNKYDDTCKTYVFCQMYNGNLVSFLYNCSDKFFDPVKLDCVSTKPSKCV